MNKNIQSNAFIFAFKLSALKNKINSLDDVLRVSIDESIIYIITKNLQTLNRVKDIIYKSQRDQLFYISMDYSWIDSNNEFCYKALLVQRELIKTKY